VGGARLVVSLFCIPSFLVPKYLPYRIPCLHFHPYGVAQLLPIHSLLFLLPEVWCRLRMVNYPSHTNAGELTVLLGCLSSSITSTASFVDLVSPEGRDPHVTREGLALVRGSAEGRDLWG
jgi:hypothetical protein